MKQFFFLVLAITIGVSPTAFAGQEVVSRVSLDNQVIASKQKKLRTAQAAKSDDAADAATVSFELLDAAETTVLICDLRGNIVRTLVANTQMDRGEYSQTWDGLDDDGEPCPGGVYVPVIEANTARKGSNTYSATDDNWGKEVFAQDMQYNQKTLDFTLHTKAYGRVRVGILDGGPIYITLAPWQIFEPGSHSLSWDGKDTTGRIDLTNRDDLYLVFDGFSLPANAIVIDGPMEISQKHYPQYPLQAANSNQPSYYALYSEPLLPEPAFEVSFKNATDKAALGKKVKFTVSLKQGIPDTNLSETMVFIDHTFAAEYQTTKTPATITFDASEIPAGKHIFTVNLITSDDRAASWSLPVTFR
ncbi:FlgD immunoglobulin-like domain containing protein [Desulfogranum japonicum]|uniref:FlgD immunoglobulin-like domain containing protein n=1 Tax=Desulfogranum japonicum TaxID=231447 RepID=UPI00041A124A|nr:FlgD immunoglobulin-like domain containing protein [Desulfogranum japonicum]